MACPEFELRILEHLDGQLPPSERTRVEAHLAGCDSCRAFAAQWQEIDAALARSVKRPALSAGFSARLWRRLEAEPALATPRQREERRRALEVEFAERSAQLRRRAFGFVGLLDALGWAVLVALVACLIVRFFPVLEPLASRTVRFSGQTGTAVGAGVLAAYGIAALLLAAGLAIVFARPARRWWRAV